MAVLIIILSQVSLASSFSPADIEWAAAVSVTLNKGGTLANGEFMVKAVQFPSPVKGVPDINRNIVPETNVDPMVVLEIYKNGVLIKELIMNLQSEAYIDPDYEVKISATGFPAKNARGWVYEYYSVEPPWATISIQIRAKPNLEVAVTTDKSAYTSYTDQTITATVTVTNSGEARAKNVDTYLDIGELKLRGGDTSQLHQYNSTLAKGASQSFSVILVVPELIDQKSYAFSANTKAYDVKDLEYKAAGSASITVSPKQSYFSISKAVKDRIYLQDIVPVRITVGNGGMFDIYNIHVADSMSENFELKSNTSFQWSIPALKPGQEWSTAYSIKPLETNLDGFTIPAATVQFTVNNKPYSASSQTPTVIVNGPKI
ncbi:MAG: CARDB domain-containing protein, partial [Candidatus Methanoperedens sp.]|nr:CARDB domain-containing protein [Candidatus Methanoperedens sp.]